MAGCYTGKILHVNLSSGELRTKTPPDDFYRKYGGGSAMGMYYILNGMPAGVDALAPENVLTLFAGLAAGIPISGQSRLCANAKSPLTGGCGDSQAGGFFPAKLKAAGFDGIVIRGKSLRPVYLSIDNGQAELRDASGLWGKTTAESEDAIRADLGGAKAEVLQIGPAGEKLVRYACLINMCNRANGRTGMGAVMGSKNLKAVAVRGNQRLSAANPREISRLAALGKVNLEEIADVKGLSLNGTADIVPWQNSVGTLPTRNYNESQFEGAQEIAGETMTDTLLKERDTCFACIVRCKRVVETEFAGQKVLPRYGGPEYETIATFGSYCGVADLPAICLANQICNEYGVDTISCGATVAFAMECYENGLLTKEDTGGLELRFGNAGAMVRLVEMIAKREGLGDLLAEGSVRAAARIGRGSADYLIAVKGNEAPAHMPQTKKSLSIIYAVNPFGADHQSSEHDPMYEPDSSPLYLERMASLGLTEPLPMRELNEEKVKFTYLGQLFYSGLDTFGLCQFVWGPAWQMFGSEDTVAMLRAATGWDLTLAEYMRVGERRLNMLRAFNAREGIDRRADVLPAKFYRPLQGTGPAAGVALDPAEIERLLDRYYELAGWDANGVPGREKLASLGLEWIK
ncbi:MAG: aldehyde ferredoxin oxidoreductase family protein [Chloroflexi bacterium]|nr:aldehyde ferredoxin oxidoreductase family protein [Chloroflexota bacterium]MCL5108522.1 aldehyde ferredoxin oxidoreductase family protein [Chloroflexota bacterium]